jgi:hypothetical protein
MASYLLPVGRGTGAMRAALNSGRQLKACRVYPRRGLFLLFLYIWHFDMSIFLGRTLILNLTQFCWPLCVTHQNWKKCIDLNDYWFLAYLWWAMAMTWRPSSSLSSCEDTFGQYAQTFFYSHDLTYIVASRRPSWRSDFCHLKSNGYS